MPLTARCHSLRPDRHSGWLCYFELVSQGERGAHFLVVGPASTENESDRVSALRAGQAAVRYLKEVPSHAPARTLLEAMARILRHESAETGTRLEFGGAVLEGDSLWLLTQGRVRLVPLAGTPVEAPEVREVEVRPDTRWFLGRLPDQIEDAEMLEAYLQRLEREGGGEGGLIAEIGRRPGPAPVRDRPRDAKSAPQLTLPAMEESRAPAVREAPLEPKPARPDPPVTPPPPEPVLPATAPLVRTPKPAGRPDPTPGPVPPVSALPAAKSAPPPRTPGPPGVERKERGPRRRSSRTYAPEETRSLGFWFGVVAAVGAFALLGAYLFVWRPTAPGKAEDLATASMEEQAEGPGPAGGETLRRQELLWEERFEGAVTSSPAVHEQTVVFGCRDGRVYALDRTTGRLLWAYAATQGFGSSPAIAGDLVVIGGYDGRVYGLDLRTGEEKWVRATGAKIVASPAVDGRNAYIGSYDQRFYAISLADGAIRWSTNLGAVLWSSPALAGDRVIVAGLDGQIHALATSDGSVRWRARVSGPIYSSPTVGGETVFVGSQDRHVYAFELDNGKPVWAIETEAAVNGSPLFHEGRLVVGTDDGAVIGIDTGEGKALWTVSTGGEVKSRPALLGDMVWVTGYDGFLHGIVWETGEPRVRFRTDSSAFSSPAVTDGVAYFGAMDGRFLAVDLGVPRT